jgi:hypothetical protein
LKIWRMFRRRTGDRTTKQELGANLRYVGASTRIDHLTLRGVVTLRRSVRTHALVCATAKYVIR